MPPTIHGSVPDSGAVRSTHGVTIVEKALSGVAVKNARGSISRTTVVDVAAVVVVATVVVVSAVAVEQAARIRAKMLTVAVRHTGFPSD